LLDDISQQQVKDWRKYTMGNASEDEQTEVCMT